MRHSEICLAQGSNPAIERVKIHPIAAEDVSGAVTQRIGWESSPAEMGVVTI
jgi:hypothetical protein